MAPRLPLSKKIKFNKTAGYIMARIEREKKTIEYMIHIYCGAFHNDASKAGGLCGGCGELLKYATERLERCTFGENKPACSKCKIHCYKKDMRDKIKAVMRYSGPRMMIYHPWLAFMHILDSFKKT